MFLLHALAALIGSATARRHPTSPNRPATPLAIELLEDRLCPSGGYLLVESFDNNSVLRYDESTGAFVDQFDLHNLGNLKNPDGGCSVRMATSTSAAASFRAPIRACCSTTAR